MNDPECVRFLQWALPNMQLKWEGFRRVRRQVCKRITRRLKELGLEDVSDYRSFLERCPEEWQRLDSLCAITISRFWRNGVTFDRLAGMVLPTLAERALSRGDSSVRCWSAGCASGEEAYSLALAWEHRLRDVFPALALHVLATDHDPHMIERAKEGRYEASSLKSLPATWVAVDFTREDGHYRVSDLYRTKVDFRLQDLRVDLPDGPFDLVLCRNVVFTYFAEPLQRRFLERVRARLLPGGALVLGSHEALPAATAGLEPWPGINGVFLDTACLRSTS